MSLDNSFTLTTLDLPLPHSSFHPIDTKNGLNLSFLLPLCSFTLAFVVGEGDLFAFLMFTFQVLLLFWSPKYFYTNNVIFTKDFTETSKSGTFFAVPGFFKLTIKNKAPF